MTNIERIRNALAKGDAKQITNEYLQAIAVQLVKITRFELTVSARSLDSNRNSLSNSNLFKSIEASITDDGIELLANFYWEFIEFGRRSGSYPPYSAIYFWAVRYRIKPRQGETLAQVVFKIQRAIFKNGIAPRPFLENAFAKSEKFINPFTDEFTEEIIRKVFN